MPLAVSATTFKGRRLARSTNERTWAANSSSRSTCSTRGSSCDRPATPPSAGAVANASAATRRTSPRPESRPIGRAPGKAELDAVVLGRVVRRREHRPGEVELSRGEVEEVGRGEADVDHTEADREHARAERPGSARRPTRECHGRRRPACRPAPCASTKRAEPDADRIGDAGVELVGDRAPDVVGLEDVVEGRPGGWGRVRGHGEASLARDSSGGHDGDDGHGVEGHVSDDRRAEPPGAPRKQAEHDAEARQAEELQCLEVHEREHERGDDDREGRAEPGAESARSCPRASAGARPRKNSSSTMGLPTQTSTASTTSPGPERVAREALGRMAEPRVEVVDERKQRRLDHRDEQVLGSHAGEDPERDVRPGPQAEPVVPNDAPAALCRPAVSGAVAGPAMLRAPRDGVLAATTAPTKPTQSAIRLTTSSPYWLGCRGCGANAA